MVRERHGRRRSHSLEDVKRPGRLSIDTVFLDAKVIVHRALLCAEGGENAEEVIGFLATGLSWSVSDVMT